MTSFDLMSSEHFHVVLHSNKIDGLIFNRLDNSVATISYDDAKELENLRKISRVYGIVGKYLNRYLVLIKNRSFVGTLCDPKTKVEHEIYVITQVQVVDINCPQLATTTSSQLASNDNELTLMPDNNRTAKENDDLSKDGASNLLSNDEAKQSSCELPSPTRPALKECEESDFSSLPVSISSSSYASQSRAWNPFKLATSIKTKMPGQLLKSTGLDTIINNNKRQSDTSSGASPNSTSQQQQSAPTNNHLQQQQADDTDKRLIDEMIKLFNNTNSFYFSPTLDLTRRFSRARSLQKSAQLPSLWETADERFFWNKHMLKDFIELSKLSDVANLFISVILQGFIAIEHHVVDETKSLAVDVNGVNNDVITIDAGLPATSMNRLSGAPFDENNSSSNCASNRKVYKLALVSRRSVFQAGTRYKRRGCDGKGNCANFVETEQIFIYSKHFTSMLILRGSIPLYWYQTGFNYRPPPVLYRNEEDNFKAFKKHFDDLMSIYETDRIIAIDCTEQTGREKALHEAYRDHMDRLRLQQPSLKLIEFDFHKHCRGRQCSDSQVDKHLRGCGLSEQLMNEARYYWNDGDVVWRQSGVFRVNCLDCSDRTNVVQRAIALQILDIQLARLGVIAPDTCPEDNDFRRIMQVLWSTNGNVLSTQYCGTRALFTGEKKLSGYLRDTYSSANRYYISKFKDAYRQAAIDAMLGVASDENNSPMEQHRADTASTSGAAPGNLDHYELINFDPIYVGRSGGALLKDVGNRVSNRLARLKGRFYVKPQFNMDSMRMSTVEAATAAREARETNETGLIENQIGHTLDGLNIDWPSSESITAGSKKNTGSPRLSPTTGSAPPICVFSQLSNSDDNFQDDDEFSQMMLSIDLAELQKLHEEEKKKAEKKENSNGEPSDQQTTGGSVVREEFDMTENCGIGGVVGCAKTNGEDSTTTTTTST